MSVKIASKDADIARCFAVMKELRPHLADEAEFVARARHQIAHDQWCLIYVEDAGQVVAVSGFRLKDCLSTGRTLYVDDLVTAETQRLKGFGAKLLSWMEEHARQKGCSSVHLDSRTQRHDAHRFYHRQGYPIMAFHLGKKL
jgi:GNAT superfamily N-acetyltransferase